MGNTDFGVSISLAATALCGAAIAAPKPAPQSWLRQGPLRNLPHPRNVAAVMPNMTHIPPCHLVAGLRTDRSGVGFTDTTGKTIARTDRMTGKLVWFDKKPGQSAPAR